LAHSLSPALADWALRRKNPMTFPLDLLVALTPFIVLGILSLIGK
jgi:hypothetical protein